MFTRFGIQTSISFLFGILIAGCAQPVASTPFSGERAYEDLSGLLEIGERVPGTPEAAEARNFVSKRLAETGHDVEMMGFEAYTPLGKRSFTNMVVKIPGTRKGVVVLSGHYDTKYFPDFPFVGANDSGSSTVFLMEMARALGTSRDGYSVWLCFFDGEEAFGEWTATDSLYGSREMVRHLRKTNELYEIRALINVDMIGDCALGISPDPEAPAWLRDAIWGEARSAGATVEFSGHEMRIEDDHIPFRRAGVPAINLIDFRYGGSSIDHNRNWHTVNDTIDRVCPESLQTVGDVLYRAIERLDVTIENRQSSVD